MLKLKVIISTIITGLCLQTLGFADPVTPTRAAEQLPRKGMGAVHQNQEIVSHDNAILEMTGSATRYSNAGMGNASQPAHPNDETYDSEGRLVERIAHNSDGEVVAREVWSYDSATGKKTKYELTDGSPDAEFGYQVITYDPNGTYAYGGEWIATDRRYKAKGDAIASYVVNYANGIKCPD